MTLSPNLAAEALKAASDVNEEPRLRATALMLALGPATEFHQLASAARERSLFTLYDELTTKSNDLMEQDRAGYWVPKSPDVESCIARLKARIKASTAVWIIHGGGSVAWKDVGRHIEREMGLKYLEFDDPHVRRVLVTERVTTMAATATVAVAVMSAEDAMPNGKLRARQNVIHEIGLAQGYLGIDRVIVMKERDIEEFTNMSGVIYISFTPPQLELAIFRLQREIETRLD